MPGLSLKTLLYSSASLLLVFFLVISGTLTLLITKTHKEANQIRIDMASVRAAQSIKVHVLEFSRANTLFALTNNSKYQTQSFREEAAIYDWLSKVKAIENASKEQRYVNQVQQKVFYYLTARKALAKERSLKKAIGEATGPLEDALASLDLLIQDSISRANRALAKATKTDRFSDHLAITSAIFAFLILVIIVIGSIRYLYYPITHINNAILNFSEGIKSSRAPEEGLADLRLIAIQFNSLADQTIEFNRKRAEFLAGTAHDLRTPLTALRSAVQLLKTHFVKLTDKQRADSINIIDKQIVRIESMTTTFLDTIRIESGEFCLNLRKVDLTQILRDAIELWRTSTDKHKFISKIPQEPIYLECDPLRMDQIVTNLMSNAIKYSPNGGTIEVELQIFDQMIGIIVKDQGLGIPPDEFGKIFEPFHRAPSVQQLVPGIGIGLWITKRLVEAHHGKIYVESKLGKGSTFKIEIPK